MPDNKSSSPFHRRYPPEMRERAVRLVAETIAEAGGERHGAVTRVARELGIGTESLRSWLRQAEIDAGQRPGLTVDSTIFNRYSPLFGVPRHYFDGVAAGSWAARIGELRPDEMDPLVVELLTQ